MELYGTTGTDRNLEFNGVSQGLHPGVIAVWKMDESSQKILDNYYADCSTCTVVSYQNRNNRVERPEYYPSCPDIKAVGKTAIYKAFPWWEHQQLPYVTQDDSDIPGSALPQSIILPVIEVPTPGGSCAVTDMTPDCRFGGGTKVGIITLGFQSTITTLAAQIEAAPLDRNAYLLPTEIPFTMTFEAVTDIHPSINYADHILPQHVQYISANVTDPCRQIVTDGYLNPCLLFPERTGCPGLWLSSLLSPN